jgi:DNA-binding LytR/AlgR family response regulator
LWEEKREEAAVSAARLVAVLAAAPKAVEKRVEVATGPEWVVAAVFADVAVVDAAVVEVVGELAAVIAVAPVAGVVGVVGAAAAAAAAASTPATSAPPADADVEAVEVDEAAGYVASAAGAGPVAVVEAATGSWLAAWPNPERGLAVSEGMP